MYNVAEPLWKKEEVNKQVLLETLQIGRCKKIQKETFPKKMGQIGQG